MCDFRCRNAGVRIRCRRTQLRCKQAGLTSALGHQRRFAVFGGKSVKPLIATRKADISPIWHLRTFSNEGV
jgi:hypothetical protein